MLALIIMSTISIISLVVMLQISLFLSEVSCGSVLLLIMTLLLVCRWGGGLLLDIVVH